MTRAITEGPQRVRRRDDTVVAISASDYNKIKGAKPVSFKEFLLNSTVNLDGLGLSRDRSTMRTINRHSSVQPIYQPDPGCEEHR